MKTIANDNNNKDKMISSQKMDPTSKGTPSSCRPTTEKKREGKNEKKKII